MKNVTISLDDDLARRARVEAAKRDMSLSKYIAEILREQVCRDDEYEAAKAAFFSNPEASVSFEGGRPPTREELYDRPVLRRH